MRPGEHNLLRRAARTWPFIRSRAPRPRRSASPSPHRHAQKRLALRRFETRLSTQTFTLGGSRVKRLTGGGESFFDRSRLFRISCSICSRAVYVPLARRGSRETDVVYKGRMAEGNRRPRPRVYLGALRSPSLSVVHGVMRQRHW